MRPLSDQLSDVNHTGQKIHANTLSKQLRPVRENVTDESVMRDSSDIGRDDRGCPDGRQTRPHNTDRERPLCRERPGCTDRERARVEPIVERALGLSVIDCRRPKTGAVADTFVLECADEPRRVVSKIGGASIWTGDVVEPLVIDRVRSATAIPVPEVYATGSIRTGDERRRWALYEYVGGDVPRDCGRDTRRRLVRSAGEMLGELHAAFEFERIGGIARRGNDLVLREPSSRNLLASSTVGRVVPVVTAGDPDCRPVLDHGDFFPKNLLVDDGEITAILDWGNAHVTHAGYGMARAEARFVDLARVDRRERSRLRRAFRAGYADRARLPPSYDEQAPFYKGLWLAQSAVNLGYVARSGRGRVQLHRQLRNWVRDRLP